MCHLCAELESDSALRASLSGEPAVPVAACDAALGRLCRLGPSVVRGQ